MRKIYFATLLCGLLLAACGATTQEIRLQSPDGKLTTTLKVGSQALSYNLSKGTQVILSDSKLGFDIKDMPSIGTKLKVVEVTNALHDQTWEQPWGEQRHIRNHYNEVLVKLREAKAPHRCINIRMRMFDDGLGFRYEFPEQPALFDFVIMQENTEFNFATNEQAWSIPSPAYYTRYYESLYRKQAIADIQDTVTTPVTVAYADGSYVAIHEAALYDYAKMNLHRTEATKLVADLSPWATGEKVYAHAPMHTPWRTVVVAPNAGALLTSRLMLNLNEPSKIADMSFFKPEVYIGVWWGMHMRQYTWAEGPKHGAATRVVKDYIDFAAANHIGGVLVEGWNIGWNGSWAKNGDKFRFAEPFPDFDIDYLSKYGAAKGVKLIGHHETAGSTLNYESQLDQAFEFCNRYGISVVKTGYVAKFLDGKEVHDGQYGVRHMQKVVETAARYHVAIVNHEPIMPTGMCRTWPNLVSQEGMRGQEYDAWSADGGNPPAHTTILPFTRGIAGPMDFTPGTFNFSNKAKPNTRVQTTLAKQLGLYIVLYSPVQMASDVIENYKGAPAFDFIRKVACDWDETVIPDAKIGEYLITARKDRHSDNWYLGAITNEQAREMTVELSFLSDGILYKAYIYEDGKDADWKTNPTSIGIRQEQVDSKTILPIRMAAGGGIAVRFEPIN